MNKHLEIMPVTLSAAKGLACRTTRSFAALRMTVKGTNACVALSMVGRRDPSLRSG
ncbi:MAG: hypothetical protein ACJ797_18360 [Ktedonobacteraceae bacterium]